MPSLTRYGSKNLEFSLALNETSINKVFTYIDMPEIPLILDLANLEINAKKLAFFSTQSINTSVDLTDLSKIKLKHF